MRPSAVSPIEPPVPIASQLDQFDFRPTPVGSSNYWAATDGPEFEKWVRIIKRATTYDLQFLQHKLPLEDQRRPLIQAELASRGAWQRQKFPSTTEGSSDAVETQQVAYEEYPQYDTVKFPSTTEPPKPPDDKLYPPLPPPSRTTFATNEDLRRQVAELPQQLEPPKFATNDDLRRQVAELEQTTPEGGMAAFLPPAAGTQRSARSGTQRVARSGTQRVAAQPLSVEGGPQGGAIDSQEATIITDSEIDPRDIGTRVTSEIDPRDIGTQEQLVRSGTQRPARLGTQRPARLGTQQVQVAAQPVGVGPSPHDMVGETFAFVPQGSIIEGSPTPPVSAAPPGSASVAPVARAPSMVKPDIADPFNTTQVEEYSKFFRPPPRPRSPTAGRREDLEAEYKGLASFLGQTDYDKQLQDATNLAKFQAALAVAQRGFASAGAAPRRGESPVSTVSRELMAPIAGDLSPIATRLIEQRRAAKTSERQEDRQLKLAALQNVQKRLDQKYESDVAAQSGARQFLLTAQRKKATVSHDFAVRGKDGVTFTRQPVIVETDYLGNITYKTGTGKIIPDKDVRSWTTPKISKPSIKQVLEIEALVRHADGKESWTPIPATLTTTFSADGTVSSSVLTESTTQKVLRTSGPQKNARKAPKPGTTGSNYFSPGKGTSVYLNESMVTAFGLPETLVNAKATLQTLVPKPEAGKKLNLPRIQTISVAGRTLTLQAHPGYVKETGNIDVTNSGGVKRTFDASGLWRLEDPKSFSPVPGSAYTVPSGDRLGQIQKISGLSKITAGQKLTLERNELGQERVQWGNQTVALTADEAKLFQTMPLSETQKIEAGQIPVSWEPRGDFVVSPENLDQIRAIPGLSGVGLNDVLNIDEDQLNNFRVRRGPITVNLSPEHANLFQTRPVDTSVVSYVNTSSGPISVGGQTVPVGKRINLSKEQYTQFVTDNPSLRVNLQPATPVDTKAKSYTFTESGNVGKIPYDSGDSISLSMAEFDALPVKTKKLLTDDPKRRDVVLKKKGILSAWKNIIATEPLLENEGDPTEQELNTLVTQFPPGTRAQGPRLREAIFDVLKFRPSGHVKLPFVSTGNAVSDANRRAFSYRERVGQEFEEAQERYYTLMSRNALPERDWESLSYPEQRAFADLPRILQLRNANDLWQKAKENLDKDRAKYKTFDQDDISAYAATAELAILAKHLRDSSDLSSTGAFLGWFGGLQSSTFADITPITSGGTQRLRSIINAMKTRYQTIAASEGDTKPSNFRVALQQELIPAFTKAESLNQKNLNVLIQRLETTLKVPFSKEILTSTVVPQSVESMAAEAGVSGKIDPKLYRWIDPRVTDTAPVTKSGVISQVLGQYPFTFKDAQNLVVGQPLPTDDDNRVFMKIRNNTDGTVVVQQAGSDGKPNSKMPLFTLTKKDF